MLKKVFANKKILIGGIIACVVVLAGAWFWLFGVPGVIGGSHEVVEHTQGVTGAGADAHTKSEKNADAHSNQENSSKGLLEFASEKMAEGDGSYLSIFTGAWESVKEKVDDLKRSEKENERLRLENANLRLQTETLRFDCQAQSARNSTRHIAIELSKETGARVGRTLSMIRYRPPQNLLPPQLYTLGVSYFKSREDEKAAVIFTFLTGLADNESYKTTRNYLMTGISWYRLDNFHLANEYFDLVLNAEAVLENLSFHAHARLWKSLVFERLGQRQLAQTWLKELVDHHPYAKETRWINPSADVERIPASVQDNTHELEVKASEQVHETNEEEGAH